MRVEVSEHGNVNKIFTASYHEVYSAVGKTDIEHHITQWITVVTNDMKGKYLESIYKSI